MKPETTTLILTIALNSLVSILVAVLILMFGVPYMVSHQLSGFGEIETITEESQVIEVASEVSPVVVSIIMTKDLPQIYDRESGRFFQDPFSEHFRPPAGSQRASAAEAETVTIEVGGGTGIIISDDGYILTNQHVVSDKKLDYTVFTTDGSEYEARVIGISDVTDLALIKIEAVDLAYASLGDSDEVVVGQTVLAIGNSLNRYDSTVTRGVISALGRSISAADSDGNVTELEDVIQTDASINPGNSGGPLINLDGEVIGINTAIDEEGENIGFSIPINQAKMFIEEL